MKCMDCRHDDEYLYCYCPHCIVASIDDPDSLEYCDKHFKEYRSHFEEK